MAQSEITYINLAPIFKIEKTDDNTLKVFGKATNEDLDSDDQVVDLKWASGALSKWLETGGNLRVQHNPSLYPAGVGIELEVKEDGAYVTGEVVEPTAKLLVEKKVLSAYSIGISHPKVVKDMKAPNGRIIGGEIVEVSLVDRPANPSCKFALAKGAGASEWSGTLEIDDELMKEAEAELAKGVGDEPSEGRESDFPEGTDFAYTDSEGGKHLPVHDEKHARLALGRFGQTNFEKAADKKKAAKKILAAAKKFGIDVDPDSDVAQSAKTRKSELDKLSEALEVVKGSRVFYTNDHKANVQKAMADLHDSLAKAFPEVCMSKAADTEDKAVEGEVHKCDENCLGNCQDHVVGDGHVDEADKTASSEELTKDDDSKDDDKDSDSDDDSDSPTDSDGDSGDDKDDNDKEDDDSDKSDKPKTAKPKKNKAIKTMKAQIKKLNKRNKELRKQYNELASAPDPAQAAVRGRFAAPVTKVATAAPEAQKSAAEIAEHAERVAWLRSLAVGGDPTKANWAQSRLADLGEEYI